MANSNNVQNVKFLRNGVVFVPGNDKTARQVALDAMELQKANLADGTAILGRYQETNGRVKTLVGFAYVSGDTKTLTVFDVDGAGADVDEKINALRTEIEGKLGTGITSSNTATAQLETLSGGTNDTSASTSVKGAKMYASAYTESKISGLDYSGLIADDNKAVYNVTEADGVVAAQAKNISEFKLAGYEESSSTGNVATTDTIGQAFGKLQKTIHEMDYTDTAVTGNYVSKVDEVDGKISVTREALPSITTVSDSGKAIIAVGESLGTVSATAGTINAEYVNIADSGEKFTATTVENALAELADKATADKIASADKTITITTASSGTDVSVNIDGTTLVKNSSTGVISSDLKIKSIAQAEGSAYASQYQLVYGSSNTPIGDVISVGKDQFLKEASYNASTQVLTLVMYNSTGGTTNIDVDFGAAIIESEAGEGLYVSTGHTLNVGIASDSEAVTISNGQGGSTTGSVLVVGTDDIKVQNIQNAIDYKVSTLDATVGSTTVASGNHVAVQVAEEDGVLTALTVTENDIANKTDLDSLSAKTVTAVEMTGGTATTANTADGTKKITINADGSSIKATGYSKGSDASGIVATDSINAALGKLENQVDTAKAAATTVVAEGTDAGNNISIAETEGADGHKIFTINLTDVASAQGLADEIAARKAVDGVNGNAYTADTSANYISGASNLYGADQALDTALNNVDNAMLTGVTAGNGISVTTKENKSQTISAVVNGDGGILNDATGLHLGTIDCGTY